MGSGLWFEPVRHNILHINLIFVMYPAGWDPKVIEMYSDVSGFFKEKSRVSFVLKLKFIAHALTCVVQSLTLGPTWQSG